MAGFSVHCSPLTAHRSHIKPNLDDVAFPDGVVPVHQLNQALGAGLLPVIDPDQIFVADDLGLDEAPGQVGVNLAGAGDDVRVRWRH